VLVEAAFVLPVLMTLVFGIVEFGLMFMNASTVNGATAAGARTAVTQARQATYATSTRDAVTAALDAIKNAEPAVLVIYRADPATGRPQGLAAGVPIESCTDRCIVYTWTGGAWGAPTGPGWEGTAQRACGTTAATDYLGVYVRARHDMVTGFFGSSKQLTDRTMMRLEPVPAPCQP
jgi:hypothetical protein